MKQLKQLLVICGMLCSVTSSHAQLSYSSEFSSKANSATVTVRTIADDVSSPSIKKRYQPIEVEIQNTSAEDVSISKGSFGLPVTSLHKVARKGRGLSLRKLPRGILIGFLVGFGIGFGGVMLNAGSFKTFGAALRAAWQTGIKLGPIMALFGAAKNIKADTEVQYGNKNYEKDQKVLIANAGDLEVPLVVPANTTVKRVFYIRKSKYKPKFDIALTKVA